MTTPTIMELLNQKDQLEKQNITLSLKKGIITECKRRKTDKKSTVSGQIEDALFEKWQKETKETMSETKETVKTPAQPAVKLDAAIEKEENPRITQKTDCIPYGED